MTIDDAMRELAELRSQVDEALKRRDRLIREALAQPGVKHGTRTKLAQAAGLSPGRVWQIVNERTR